MWDSKWGQVCRGNEVREGMSYMCTSENRDHQLASRSALKGLAADALATSASSLFTNGTARTRTRVGEGGYNGPAGGTYRRGCIALCGLDGCR